MPAQPLTIVVESGTHVGWVERRETRQTQVPSHQESPPPRRQRLR
ncbi:hypothetical protein [Thiorhodovibrio winogradskyi]|nr:hypothetical protein [Thiorhodovibrio winogradskyi]